MRLISGAEEKDHEGEDDVPDTSSQGDWCRRHTRLILELLDQPGDERARGILIRTFEQFYGPWQSRKEAC